MTIVIVPGTAIVSASHSWATCSISEHSDWRRAAAAGIETELGCHSFRATGITVYLKNGGLLEHAQQMAAHESARTTKLYDRTGDDITFDEVERITIELDLLDRT
jgi:integrase